MEVYNQLVSQANDGEMLVRDHECNAKIGNKKASRQPCRGGKLKR
jgi:hypothetical protein